MNTIIKLLMLSLVLPSLSQADARTSGKCDLSTRSRKLVFHGVDGRDVYNPTKPFAIKFYGREILVMAARVEARNSEQSQAMFFVETGDGWSRLEDAPVFDLQDPFFTFINGELIFGGVETYAKLGGGTGYKTVFFRGENLEDLNPKLPYTKGPEGMKDIRLVQLKDGRIGLFTRPQGWIDGTDIDAGAGKIGFKIIDSLFALKIPGNIADTPLIPGQFSKGEWGGVNEAQILPDGRIAVLMHVAHFYPKEDRHYYSGVFTIDPSTGIVSPIETILKRAYLTGGLNGDSKRPDLIDVIFSGGMNLHADTLTLFVGAGDAEVHFMILPMPRSFKL